MTFLVLSIALLLLLVAFATLFQLLASRLNPVSDPTEWLDGFSVESYAPMRRLLGHSDLEFLKKQPGYRPETARTLQAERRKAFKGYLDLMVADFNQLLRIGRFMLTRSKVDRPEFARALWREQAKFYFAIYSIRIQLALYPLGLRPERLELLDSLGSMFQQVQALAAPRVPAY